MREWEERVREETRATNRSRGEIWSRGC